MSWILDEVFFAHRKHFHLVDARLAFDVEVPVLLGGDPHVGDHLGDRVVVLVDHVDVLLLAETLVLSSLPGDSHLRAGRGTFLQILLHIFGQQV